MKSLNDLIPALFNNYSNSIDAVTSRLSKLSDISSYGSTFKNALQVAKLVTAEADASKTSMNLFDWVDQLTDVGFTQTNDNNATFSKPTDDFESQSLVQGALKLGEAVHWNYDSDPEPDYVIGYVGGAPIRLYAHKSVNNDVYRLMFSVKPITDDNWSTFMDIIIWYNTYDDVSYVEATLFCNKDVDKRECWIGNTVDGIWDPHYAAVTVEQILSSVCNNFVTNECFSNVIARAQADGNITISQIKDIASHYSTTDGINELTSLIAGMDSLSSISVVTLIGKIMSKANGNYNEGNDYYTLYSDPGYINSIIQAVVTVLISLVAVILSILFKAIAAIVTVVTAMLSSILSIIESNLPKTSVTIDEISLTPVINYQLATFDITANDVSSKGFYNVTFDEIMEQVNENGCAMLSLPVNGQSPAYLWIIPKDTTTLTVQVLINGTLPYNTTIGWGSYNFIPWYDINSSDYLHCSFTNDPEWSMPYNTPDDASYDYLSYTDIQVRRALTINSMLFLQHCINGTNPISIPAGSTGLNVAGWKKNDDPTKLDWSKIGLGTLISRAQDLDNDDNFDLITRIVAMYSPCVEFLIANANYSAPEWSILKEWFDLCNNCSDAIKEIAFPTWYNRASQDQYTYIDLGSGVTLAKPSIKWPELAKSALLRAVLITGLATVAMAGIAIGVKVGMKRVAFKKLAVRSDQFDTAKANYQNYRANYFADKSGVYTKEGLQSYQKAYYKANRKLTKAWNFASKFGLSMYNGFSTGSTNDDNSPSSSPLSSAGELYTSIFDVSDINATNLTDTSISFRDLYKVIAGI